MKIELNFDPHEVKAEMRRMPWEREDRFTETRRVYLGSVFALTPSGKYYQPFACSNVDACPVCGGSGHVRGELKRRTARKWRNRNTRMRKLWIRRYGPASDGKWPKRIHVAALHLNQLQARLHAATFCVRCDGCGSAEAADDERWKEMAEEALGELGFSLESGEGDPCDYFAVQSRDTKEVDEEGDDGAAEQAEDEDEDEDDSGNEEDA